jgi:predicted small secreted protein
MKLTELMNVRQVRRVGLRALVAIGALWSMSHLLACHTVEGLGEDIEDAGEEIQDAAD